MSTNILDTHKPLNTHQLNLCLKGVLSVNLKYLKDLRTTRGAHIMCVNKRNQILENMEILRSEASKTCIRSQDLNWKYNKMWKDACIIFGSSFKYLLNQCKLKRNPQKVKDMKRTLKKIHKMGLPQRDNIPIKSVKEYVITLSDRNVEQKYKTDYYEANTMSKICTIASDDDTKLFEFMRSIIAEKLRMDIVKEDRVYIMWYTLKKIDKQLDSARNFISECASKYYVLLRQLNKLPVSRELVNLQDILLIDRKCKKLEYGIKILDDYNKIYEFAQFASEYGRSNSSDPDVVQAVELVNIQAHEQLNLIHNELIGVRNYCDIQRMSIFE